VGSHGIGEVTGGGTLNGVSYWERDSSGEGNGSGRAPGGGGEARRGNRHLAGAGWWQWLCAIGTRRKKHIGGLGWPEAEAQEGKRVDCENHREKRWLLVALGQKKGHWAEIGSEERLGSKN
jgi:hypothetical protein